MRLIRKNFSGLHKYGLSDMFHPKRLMKKLREDDKYRKDSYNKKRQEERDAKSLAEENAERERVDGLINAAGLKKPLTIPSEFKKLFNIDRDPKLGALLSKLGGDGDEYAVLYFRNADDTNYWALNDKNELVAGSVIDIFDESYQYNFNTKKWLDWEGKSILFSKIKSEIVHLISEDLKEWEKNRYWDDESDNVIEYLKYFLQLVKTKL